MEETLFGCFDDVGDCVYAVCCGPCHLGGIAKNTGSDCCTTCLIAHCFPFPIIINMYTKSVLETALRRVGVTQDIDCFTCMCCLGCVQCQVAREIKNRQAKMAVAGGVPAQAQTVVVVHAPAPVAATK